MRATKDWSLACDFAGDLPGGGTLVECPHCHRFTALAAGQAGTAEFCGHCKRELFYPDGAEW